MRTIMFAAASIVALAGPACANPDVPPAVQSAGARPGEPLICKLMYYNGAITMRPICRTEHQWIRSRIRQEAEVREFQIRALTGVGGH